MSYFSFSIPVIRGTLRFRVDVPLVIRSTTSGRAPAISRFPHFLPVNADHVQPGVLRSVDVRNEPDLRGSRMDSALLRLRQIVTDQLGHHERCDPPRVSEMRHVRVA